MLSCIVARGRALQLLIFLCFSLLVHLAVIFWPSRMGGAALNPPPVLSAQWHSPGNVTPPVVGARTAAADRRRGAAEQKSLPEVAAVPRQETKAEGALPVTANSRPETPAALPVAVTAVDAAGNAPVVRESDLRAYRVALAGEIAALRRAFQHRYEEKELQQGRGWSGRVEFILEYSASTPGGAASLKMRRSSGHVWLDEQAEALFSAAVARVALPSGLRARHFSLPLVMEFALGE